MIIIPDVHGRQFWRKAAHECAGWEHLVFLGDYLDPYHDEGIDYADAYANLLDIVRLKEQYPDDVTLLLGNHDIHYLDYDIAGSRYDDRHAGKNRSIFVENDDKFQMAYEASIGGKKYLFSHAGILSGWIRTHSFLFGAILPEDLVNYINTLWRTKETRRFLLRALSDASYFRQGRQLYGSMVWADVKEHSLENYEIPNYYQIFGHTMLETPLITPFFACLDCKATFRIDESGEFYRLK